MTYSLFTGKASTNDREKNRNCLTYRTERGSTTDRGDKALLDLEGRRKWRTKMAGERINSVNFIGGPSFPSSTLRFRGNDFGLSRVKLSPSLPFSSFQYFFLEQVKFQLFPSSTLPSSLLPLSEADP